MVTPMRLKSESTQCSANFLKRNGRTLWTFFKLSAVAQRLLKALDTRTYVQICVISATK